MLNTYKFAHISELVYSDKVKLAGYECQKIEDVETDTQCFIFSDDTTQIVAFRGTKPSFDNLQDIKTDLNCKMNAGVHSGVEKAYNSIAQILIDSLDPKKMTVYIGHSLGGGLAIFACRMDMSTRKVCVVFGALRIFDSQEAKIYNELNGHITFRFEAKGDPVPFMPPYLMGYRHVGKCIYLDGKETIFENCSVDGFISMLFKGVQSHSITNYKNQLAKVYLND